MKGRRHTPEQVIRKLRVAERLLAEGKELPEVAKHRRSPRPPSIAGATEYGALKADDAKLLKELKGENSRLKRIVADKELEIDALREIAKGNW